MKAYTVQYRMFFAGEVKSVMIPATSKYDAYDRATYDLIPEKEGRTPYSSWVESVTYNNGNYHVFNNSEGNAF